MLRRVMQAASFYNFSQITPKSGDVNQSHSVVVSSLKAVSRLRRSVKSLCTIFRALTDAAITYRPFGAQHHFSEN
jgi:hypothetical protein